MKEREYEQFKEFIRKVIYEDMTIEDYEFVLTELDFSIRSKGNPKYWLLSSSCHNVDPTTAKSNVQFWLDKKSFKCYSSCKCTYNILTLTEKRFKTLGKKKNRFQCMKWICELLDIPFDFKDESKQKSEDIYNWKAQLSKYTRYDKFEFEIKLHDKRILDYFPKLYHEDWIEYGISEEVMEQYGIRWYPYKQQIVIPCIDKNGDLIGIRIRNMNPNHPVKYMPLELLDGTSYSFPTGAFMYGENFNSEEISRTRTVWLVEAEKSVLKSATWFGDGNIALALYGHELQEEKLKYLISLGVEDVYLMLDSDFHEIGDNKEYEIFEERIFKIYKLLKPYVRNIYVVYNNQGYDGYKYSPFDFTREQFDVLMKNKERIEDE